MPDDLANICADYLDLDHLVISALKQVDGTEALRLELYGLRERLLNAGIRYSDGSGKSGE